MNANLPSDQTPRKLSEVRRLTWKQDLVTLSALEIDVAGRTLRYSAGENSGIIAGRVASIFAKEPTTIPYLETFEMEDVFLDIGANIGLYSIYAAVMTGCKVLSVEPEALNYAELNKNIYLNGLHDRVLAYCAAAGAQFELGKLLLGAFAAGWSHHDFGESTWRKDMQWTPDVRTSREARITQGSVSISIDDCIARGMMPQPSHIKIDVDGHEPKVIAGMLKTLQHPSLKTVLVEIDFGIPECQAIIDIMVSMGWRYSMDQLITNRAAVMKPERVQELRRIGKDGFNYIFYRDPAYDALFRDFLARYDPPQNLQGKLKFPPRMVSIS